MCKSIKPLFNFDPVATDDEIHAAALQFVRKVSGFTKPSQANEAAFFAAVDDIAMVSKQLIGSLHTHADPKNRQTEQAKRQLRSVQRYSQV